MGNDTYHAMQHENLPVFYDKWRPFVEPMNSAYKLALGKEPDYTNCARVRNDPIFFDTLDYIFLSSNWKVNSVVSLPVALQPSEMKPMPLANEPSDHLLLSANIELCPEPQK